jgi:O-antigen/teichoic acid export membrane protein
VERPPEGTVEVGPVPVSEPGPTPFGRLGRDLVIYGSGRIAFQLLIILSIPIITRIFTTSEFGVIETMTATTAALAVVVLLGLDSASQRSYFDYTDEQVEERRTVLSTTFWTLLVWSALVCGVLALLSGPLSDWLFGETTYQVVVGLAMALVAVEIIFLFLQEVFRVRHQPMRYAVLSIVWGLATIGLMLTLVAGFDRGLRGYYLGFVLGGLLTIGIGLFAVRDSLRLRWDRRELRTMLAFGLPLVPLAASTWVIQLVDRFFLLHYSSTAELGLYGLGVRLANLLMLAVITLGLAWAPFVFDLAQRDPAEEKRVRARSLTYTAILLGFGAVVISVFAREVFVTVTDPSFEDAYKVVGLSSAVVVAIGLNAVTMTGISLERKTIYFARYAVYVAVLNIALNFLLIPPLEMVGAALATALTYAVLAGLYYYRAQIVDRAPFRLEKILVALTTAAVLISIGTFVNLDPIWLSVLVKLPLVAAFPVAMILFRVLDPEAMELLRRLKH